METDVGEELISSQTVVAGACTALKQRAGCPQIYTQLRALFCLSGWIMISHANGNLLVTEGFSRNTEILIIM